MIWTQQVIFRNRYVYTNIDMHTITISEERSHEFERRGEGHLGRLRGSEGREKCYN